MFVYRGNLWNYQVNLKNNGGKIWMAICVPTKAIYFMLEQKLPIEYGSKKYSKIAIFVALLGMKH